MAPAANLPMQLTTFIGRDRELTAATHQLLLTTTRLLTLTGSGGIGKSRLALRMAECEQSHFADGVWLAELAALSEPPLVPHTVAAALGIRERSDISTADTLVAELREKQVLLVLDNCEHLLESCAALVDELLRHCPDLKVLATSRQSLGVAGEVTWRVPPLALPHDSVTAGTDELAGYEAIRLFVDRARLVVPELHLNDQNANTIARICRQLDGIPLALELAAARVRSLGVEQIAARLDNRFGLLTGGLRGALERHQTLRAAVEWSYDLLSESERALFRRLGVFAGGWSLEAAETLCAGGEVSRDTVLDLLAHLVDRSLVLADGQELRVRYRLLETLRQFAAEQADAAGETTSLRDRHLQWYTDLVERADTAVHGQDQSAGLDLLEREHDNIRAALGWAIEASGERVEAGLRLAIGCCYFWQIRGHRYRREALRWLEQLLGANLAATPLVARAQTWAATFAAELFDFARAAELHSASRDISTKHGDKQQLVQALLGLGTMHRLQGRYAEAWPLLEHSLAITRELADATSEAYVLRQLGALARDTRDPVAGESYSRQALAIFEAQGERHQAGHLLDQVGVCARDRGEFATAQDAHQHAMELLGAAGCEEGYRSSITFLAQLAFARGQHAEAARLAMESLRRDYSDGVKRDIPLCLELLSAVAAASDATRAARLLGAASGLRARVGTVRPPADDDTVQSTRAHIVSRLGARAADAEFTAGAQFSLADAVSYSLNVPLSSSNERGRLTPRERQVAILVGRGLSNRAIAEELVLSVRTTEAHVTHVLTKLGLRSRAQLAVWASEQGLLAQAT
jgi:non-specific serine/threonine protein kinase